MRFTQIMEFESSSQSDVLALEDRWERETEGKRPRISTQIGQDRDRPNHYVGIVTFESYDDAMKNNAMVETDAFAADLRQIANGNVRYVNLDLIDESEDL